VNARLAAFAAAVALTAGALAGCAVTPGDISSGTAAELQTTVVAIAESAAAGDPAGALAQLDALQQQLDAAVADGSVSAERAAAIQSRMDLVRADLQPPPVVEPTTEPAPAPAVTDGGDDDDDDGGGNENSGPGNNNGDENGKGKGKDD
jgi:ribosomal protein S20